MSAPRLQAVGNVALGLSLLVFAVFFLNVVLGGPLKMTPWMGDVGEMLTLLVAVVLFVAGTLAREATAKLANGTPSPGPGDPDGATE